MEGKSLKQNHTFGFLKRINQNNLITFYINNIRKLKKLKKILKKKYLNKNLLFKDMEY